MSTFRGANYNNNNNGNLNGGSSNFQRLGNQGNTKKSPLDKIQAVLNDENFRKNYLQKFENFTDRIESYSDLPIFELLKPYTPLIARLLIVATFYEDSIRIVSQWKDQVFYLWNYRHIPYFLVLLFLSLISVTMIISSSMLILRKKIVYATSALIITVVLQAFVYGLVSGFTFVLRNISVIGGLLIALGDSIVTSKGTFGLLPELHNKTSDMKNFILLTGRILIVVMFVTFSITKNWITVILTIFGTLLISIGYKTKFASILLLLILFFYNITINNYWFYKKGKRDFLKYEFYQNLSIMGGLLLTVNTGAGKHSLDEKKKIY